MADEGAGAPRREAVPPDDALISALAGRDLSALAALYDRYARISYALAYRILGEAEAAEDVVHDGFISAWRGAASYRSERGNVRGWKSSLTRRWPKTIAMSDAGNTPSKPINSKPTPIIPASMLATTGAAANTRVSSRIRLR